MNPIMITTPKGIDNWTRSGVGKNSLKQITASCYGSVEISTKTHNIKLEPGKGDSLIVKWEKKDQIMRSEV
jgi:hypothetical protein